MPIGKAWFTTLHKEQRANALFTPLAPWVVSVILVPKTEIQEPGATALPAVKLAASTMPPALMAGATRA